MKLYGITYITQQRENERNRKQISGFQSLEEGAGFDYT